MKNAPMDIPCRAALTEVTRIQHVFEYSYHVARLVYLNEISAIAHVCSLHHDLSGSLRSPREGEIMWDGGKWDSVRHPLAGPAALT